MKKESNGNRYTTFNLISSFSVPIYRNRNVHAMPHYFFFAQNY